MANGNRAIDLPGPVTFAILPHTPHSVFLAKQAHSRQKEVLLHLPMEAINRKEPGPGKIDSTMPAIELKLTVAYDLERVPHVIGINNHMGSLLTQQVGPMANLMAAIKQRGGLFFVDSLTSPKSLAGSTAARYRVPYLVRDVFLDNDRSRSAIDQQISLLITIARKRGSAIAIAHPYPETLAALENWIPRFPNYNIKLVPLSTQLTLKPQEQALWQTSSSP